jgi:predicted nucleic acid-binding protein
MSAVFVDTSALLPLLDTDDRDHERVVAAMEDIAARERDLVTSSYTLVEAGALVRRRLGVKTFRALGEVASRAMEVVWVDEDLHDRAWAAASTGRKKGPSLVDHVAFEIMRDLELDTVLAIDRHFAREGFATLP